MQKIDWCEGGLQLADIGPKYVSEPYLTPSMKNIYLLHQVGKESFTLRVIMIVIDVIPVTLG